MTDKTSLTLAAIQAGDATIDKIMEAIGSTKAGAMAQISKLNAKGLIIAEIDPSRAEFPLRNKDGVYTMCSHEQYLASKETVTRPTREPKKMTVEQITAFVRKRADAATKAAERAFEAVEKNAEDKILALNYAAKQAEAALMDAKLAAVESGDFNYERVTIVENVEDTEPEATTETENIDLL